LHAGLGVAGTLLLVVVAVAAAVWVADRADHVLGEHDSGRIVVDEVVGMMVALLWIPPTVLNVALAFAMFRVLDVVKPWPAGFIDRRMPGGAGVVLDDVVSGIYANLLLRLLL
jgi:phosphatidylglycerophosphatase A